MSENLLVGFSHNFVYLLYLFNQDACLGARNGNRDSQKYLQDMFTNTRTCGVHTSTQTVRIDHHSDISKPGTTDQTILETSSQTNHNKDNSQVRIVLINIARLLSKFYCVSRYC